MKARFCASVRDIAAADWDRLTHAGGPLLSHRFLSILEETGAVGPDTGWEPQHLLLQENDQLLAAVPLYLKTHSWGEYVFDWSWADAWHRLGIPYYPKLVTAIPLTPVAGPRLCTAPGTDRTAASAAAVEAIQSFARQHKVSGWHILFPEPAEIPTWDQQGLVCRTHCNFQWFNRDYPDYQAFLADMTSRARKSIRRERRKICEQGLSIRQITGTEATEADWRQMYLFYRDTCLQRGQSGYLSEDFFVCIGERMADETLLTLATDGGLPVAGAFCLFDRHTLYGRYWGSLANYDSLHFELCYHRGVDFCIANGLARYDPGAQGEHKIRRGFIPMLSHSMHWVAEERLQPAVKDFCRREQEGLEQYRLACRQLLPFRADREELLEPPQPS